ncbi:hypothetical protein OENI_10220 [Oenococcus oeni]|nr:hypothetical protein OENI_10220 [Oenococcus oeni]
MKTQKLFHPHMFMSISLILSKIMKANDYIFTIRMALWLVEALINISNDMNFF